ncbi:MAG: hypothetical protein MUC58_02410 [Rhizobiaceae bacterium]|jgi:protein ImuA|nr:hypothetical protein [Rhizobiaceae bacterium]
MSGSMPASQQFFAPAGGTAAAQAALARLREQVARAGAASGRHPAAHAAEVHHPALPGRLAAGALHEMFAASGADAAAACGFAALSAMIAAQGRAILWVRQTMIEAEFGLIHPPGLIELGLDPARVALVRVRDAGEALKAADEAVRCGGLGALIVDLHGNPAKLDLTATRRLSLGAAQSGVTAFLTRSAGEPAPNAAATRWRVQAAPSRALEARAPGPPAFGLTLLRDRTGGMQRHWQVEWNRDETRFELLAGCAEAGTAGKPAPHPPAAANGTRAGAFAALSEPVAALSFDRPDQAAGGIRRRTG